MKLWKLGRIDFVDDGFVWIRLVPFGERVTAFWNIDYFGFWLDVCYQYVVIDNECFEIILK